MTTLSHSERLTRDLWAKYGKELGRRNANNKRLSLPDALKRIEELEAMVDHLRGIIKANGIEMSGRVGSLKDAGWLTAKQYADSIGVSVSQVTRNWPWLRSQGAIQEGNGYLHIPVSLSGVKYPRKPSKRKLQPPTN